MLHIMQFVVFQYDGTYIHAGAVKNTPATPPNKNCLTIQTVSTITKIHFLNAWIRGVVQNDQRGIPQLFSHASAIKKQRCLTFPWPVQGPNNKML